MKDNKGRLKMQQENIKESGLEYDFQVPPLKAAPLVTVGHVV